MVPDGPRLKRRAKMNFLQDSLEGFLAREHRIVIVDVTAVKGSAPRDAGTFMLVAPTEIHGTIGGGQLEYVAIENARKMLGDAGIADRRYPGRLRRGHRHP
jgi:xanthine dehydrogenase accessory factor